MTRAPGRSQQYVPVPQTPPSAAWQATRDTHQREQRRRKGLANYRLVRYADDWLVLVAGTQADAERLREEAAVVLLPMGLRLHTGWPCRFFGRFRRPVSLGQG